MAASSEESEQSSCWLFVYVHDELIARVPNHQLINYGCLCLVRSFMHYGCLALSTSPQKPPCGVVKNYRSSMIRPGRIKKTVQKIASDLPLPGCPPPL